MTSVRASKSKGSQFEMDCTASLKQSYRVKRLGCEGFQGQYDIRIDDEGGVWDAIECKRLSGISWNQLVKFHKKLQKVTPGAREHIILFKSNFQPCLVFNVDGHGEYYIKTFLVEFGVPFIKHKSTRVKK